jgi:hypothetical protein
VIIELAFVTFGEEMLTVGAIANATTAKNFVNLNFSGICM